MSLVRIPKKYPHKRICIFCDSRNVRNLYCNSCNPYRDLLPYIEHSLVKKFIYDPDIAQLISEYNFQNRSAIVTVLKKLRVPVKKYTLNYLLYNYSKYEGRAESELIDRFEFNVKSVRFRVLYHKALTDPEERDKYESLWWLLTSPIPITMQAEKVFGIKHETLTLVRKFFSERKIVY